MPFMVIYSTSDGASCHEQADAIDEAALFVERLRNKDGIEEVRIYRMEEISFAFRPYYKVELGMPERQAERPSTAPTSEVVGPNPSPPVAHEPGVGQADPGLEVAIDEHTTPPSSPRPAPAPGDPTGGDNGRRGLFGR